MKISTLGNSNLAISPVGLGCMGLSHAFGTPLAKQEAAQRIRAAFDMGYRFFDTAECYTGTNPDGTTAYNEEAVGLGIKGIRRQLTLATKCGIAFSGSQMILDSSPTAIRKALEGSLKRLGTDYIDLYYQHWVDPKTEPEVVAETMGQLIKEGKVRAWGISNAGESYIRRAHAVCPVSAVENIYSMIDRKTEELFHMFDELGITLVAYTPLAKGFLSGSYLTRPEFDSPEDNRSGRYQFSEEGFAYYQAVLHLLRRLGEEKEATPAQITLAWMTSKATQIVPIPGTRSVEHMRQNLQAADFVLSASEVKSIDQALDNMKLLDTASFWA